MTALDVRVVRSDGVVLVEQHLEGDDVAEGLVEAAAEISGERTADAVAAGYWCELQCRDPDGENAEWIGVVRVGTTA